MKQIYISSPNWEKIKTFIKETPNKIVIIYCHGFTWDSSSWWLTWKIWEKLWEQFLSIRFDFRWNWESEGNFYNLSITRELEDLSIIISYVKQNYNPEKIIIIWHSFGAAISLLYAAKDHVDWLILVSWEWDLEKQIDLEFTKSQQKDFEQKWETLLQNWSLNWELSLIWKQFIDDMKSYSTLDAATQINIPCLLIHWNKDDVVPKEFSQEIYDFIRWEKELFFVDWADHSFNIFHDNTDKKLNELIDIIDRWIKKFL